MAFASLTDDPTVFNGGFCDFDATAAASAAIAAAAAAHLQQQQQETRIFEDLLDAEVFLNAAKLREAARRGVPQRYRGTVYRLLLGVTSMDKSGELTLERMLEEDFALLGKACPPMATAEAQREAAAWVWAFAMARQAVPSVVDEKSGGGDGGDVVGSAMPQNGDGRGGAGSGSSGASAVGGAVAASAASGRGGTGTGSATLGDSVALRKTIEAVLKRLRVVHWHAPAETVHALFHFTQIFAHCCRAPQDVLACVQALATVLRMPGNALRSSQTLRHQCGQFLALLRASNESLYSHLVAEDVHFSQWLPPLLTTLLAASLHRDDVLRFWDAYLADIDENAANGFALHTCVCLALLQTFTEELIELDGLAVVAFLRAMPRVDAESILERAAAIREDLRARELLL